MITLHLITRVLPSRRTQLCSFAHRPPKLITWTRTWLLLASGVVLQTVIYKGLYGIDRFFLKEIKNVMFLNKIDVPYCLVVFFVVCPRLRPFWSVFGELALFWCPTAKRKTVGHQSGPKWDTKVAQSGPASYWHSSPGGAGVLNKFLYGGGPPLNLLYTIFHNFVYLLLKNGTPFTYLAKNFVSVLTAGNPHCHKIGISHKYRTLSRRVRGWTSGRSLPVQIFVEYLSGISGGASPYRPPYWEYPPPGHSKK